MKKPDKDEVSNDKETHQAEQKLEDAAARRDKEAVITGFTALR